MFKRRSRRALRALEVQELAPTTKANKETMNMYGHQTSDTILKLPLNTLMAIPVEILNNLPAEKAVLLPPEVLQRLSPLHVLAELPSENLAMLPPINLAAVLRYDSSIFSRLPDEALAKLRKRVHPHAFQILPPHIQARLSQLDSDQVVAPAKPELCLSVDSSSGNVSSPRLPENPRPTSVQTSFQSTILNLRAMLEEEKQAHEKEKSQRIDLETTVQDLTAKLEEQDHRHEKDAIQSTLEEDLMNPTAMLEEEKENLEAAVQNFRAMLEEEKQAHEKEKSQRIDLETTVQDLTAKLEEQDQRHQEDANQQRTFESDLVNLTAKLEEQEQRHQEDLQNLTAKLDEQKQSLSQATQDRNAYEAEKKGLQQTVDTQDTELAKYQRIIKSEEERHTATVERLIGEHLAEVGDLMASYEKELAETRMAHDTERARRGQRYLQDIHRLQDEIMALESKLGVGRDLEEDLGQPAADDEPKQNPNSPPSSPSSSSGRSSPQPSYRSTGEAPPRTTGSAPVDDTHSPNAETPR